ncbi:MAG: glycoside hydrolase family 3 protein [Epsilonproteobacteria bacterium]|nr:glycoside hydrolase family 3 protein [Campylobacterota bacterium]
MRHFLFLLLLYTWPLTAADLRLERQVARLFMIGVPGQSLRCDSDYARTINALPPGGVILFDEAAGDPMRANIRSPKQLASLTRSLMQCTGRPLLIAVDQEGGRVRRLRPEAGFVDLPAAKEMANLPPQQAYDLYVRAAKQMHRVGINVNFAPVLDLAINQDNPVIAGLGRAYGKDPETVTLYASLFADALRANGIVPVFKHFPGHGSAAGDTHKGFVDVTTRWQRIELFPYLALFEPGGRQMVMTAHIFNKNLDPYLPATLSKRVLHDLLREKMGFDGVVVTDALGMRAIADRYGPEEAAVRALEAGADLLLFAEVRDASRYRKLVAAVAKAVREGRLSRQRLDEAAARLKRLKTAYGIGEKR